MKMKQGLLDHGGMLRNYYISRLCPHINEKFSTDDSMTVQTTSQDHRTAVPLAWAVISVVDLQQLVSTVTT